MPKKKKPSVIKTQNGLEPFNRKAVKIAMKTEFTRAERAQMKKARWDRIFKRGKWQQD